MPSHFWWVFCAYGVVWLAIIFYLVRLFTRQNEAERQLEILRGEHKLG